MCVGPYTYDYILLNLYNMYYSQHPPAKSTAWGIIYHSQF